MIKLVSSHVIFLLLVGRFEQLSTATASQWLVSLQSRKVYIKCCGLFEVIFGRGLSDQCDQMKE